MRIRTKIFLGYFLAAAAALYFLMSWMRDDVRKRYLESIEENMVDTANILATIAAENAVDGKINTAEFATVFEKVHKRSFKAHIYDVTKSTVDSQVYITDSKGTVLFDSGNPANTGKDFSKWRDVALTLKGKYGARATRVIKDKPSSLIMYISAPITSKGQIIGVLTLYKPVDYVTIFIKQAKKRILIHTLSAVLIVVMLGIIMSVWIAHPVLKLTHYTNAVKNGEKVSLPNIGHGEVGILAHSFDEMRKALEGKQYVEEYIQNMTHELKSPIAAIHGALELLSENRLPVKQRDKFLKNARHETLRMRRIVDRMLLLSQLENINTIHQKRVVDIGDILNEIVQNAYARIKKRKMILNLPDAPVKIKGDRMLLFESFENIISNAIDFTSKSGIISITLEETDETIKITVKDDGTGIPEYAVDRVFDKFYSLPRPGDKEKSSGLGLSITKQIIELHGGTVELTNNPGNQNGTQAVISLPRRKNKSV